MNAIVQTSLAMVLLIQGAAAGEKHTSLRSLHAQAGAPLQQATAMFNEKDLTLLLVNVSSREVIQTVVGVVLEDGASVVPAVTRVGTVCNASVPPDGFLVVTTANTGFDAAPSYFRSKGITKQEVTAGLVRVRFAGGDEWVYDLNAQGRFEEKADEKLAQRIQSLMKERFGEGHGAAVAALFPGSDGKVSRCQK